MCLQNVKLLLTMQLRCSSTEGAMIEEALDPLDDVFTMDLEVEPEGLLLLPIEARAFILLLRASSALKIIV